MPAMNTNDNNTTWTLSELSALVFTNTWQTYLRYQSHRNISLKTQALVKNIDQLNCFNMENKGQWRKWPKKRNRL